MAISSQKPLVQYLSTNGDGTGTINAIGTYAAAAETFEVQPAAGETYVLSRIMWYVSDAGNFDADKWGNAITLTNGITLKVLASDGTELVDLTPQPIKTTGNLANYCYDVDVKAWGVGNQVMVARWTFAKHTAGGEGVILNEQERLVIGLNDDFDDLVEQHWVVEGYVRGDYY